MARTFYYIVLLSIVAVIVAVSGCASTPTNNTQAPATPVTTPVTVTATPSETPVIRVETPSVTTTPSTGAKNETPIVGGFNATKVDNGNLKITPSTNVTSTVSNETHISTTQKYLQIERASAGVTSTVSNGTVTVVVNKPTYGLTTNPLSTKKNETNPINNTSANTNAVTQKSGTLKIIPAEESVTSTGNQTVNLGTAQRNAQKIIAAQNAKGSGSSAGTAQNVTGK